MKLCFPGTHSGMNKFTPLILLGNHTILQVKSPDEASSQAVHPCDSRLVDTMIKSQVYNSIQNQIFFDFLYYLYILYTFKCWCLQ